MKYSCYCDEGEACGPHHNDPDSDWCPLPPTIQHSTSFSHFCQPCADAHNIPPSERIPENADGVIIQHKAQFILVEPTTDGIERLLAWLTENQ